MRFLFISAVNVNQRHLVDLYFLDRLKQHVNVDLMQ